jgi:hypothetical protein
MRVWVYLLRIVGALVFLHVLADFFISMARYGDNFWNWSSFFGSASGRTLQGIAVSLLCFGAASVISTFHWRHQRELEAQYAEQQRLLQSIEDIAHARD